MTAGQHLEWLELERYRRYLTLLAEAELDPRLRVKESPSDIVQQSLLEAHCSLADFRGRTEPELLGWLKTILARNLLNTARHFRTAKRDIRLEQQLMERLDQSSARLDQLLIDHHSSPSQRAEQNERIAALTKAFESLLEQERTAIILKHLQDWSLKEISEHLGRPPDAVAGLLRRGLKKLRSQMQTPE